MTELTLAAGVPIGDGAGGGDASAEAWLLLAGYAALALVVSFLCSMLEASLLSLPRSHVQLLVEQGKPVGTLLLRMKNHLDRPLAAILTLNTIAHTIGAAGVGAQVLNIFGSAWVFAGSVIITLAILYLSEIVPKGLGATFAKPLAPFTGRTIQTLEWLTAPFVWVASAIGRVFGGMESSDVTRDEVGVYARMGEAAGELRPQESRVIRNLLRLRDVPVADVMTPRSVVFMLQADATCGDVVEEHSPIRFTRIPIYNNDRDDVLGFVLRKQTGAGSRQRRSVGPQAPRAHPAARGDSRCLAGQRRLGPDDRRAAAHAALPRRVQPERRARDTRRLRRDSVGRRDRRRDGQR
ncbi:MAG: CNNM domain-containing protein [Planctomycetota bacterium]